MMMYCKQASWPAGGRTARPGHRVVHHLAACLAACVACAALPAPAAAIQILDAADHAELEAAVSATGVTRVALAGDRIRRVIRSPGGFDVEHDPASGDLYLRPPEVPETALDEVPAAPLPITLFLGTEQGFTYRLTLTPDPRPSAQVLIRNAAAGAESTSQTSAVATRDARVADLVRLVRAAARGESLPGYVVEASRPGSGRGPRVIETWRGARFTALVLAAGPDTDAGALAERYGTGVAAVWIAGPQAAATRDDIAVVVTGPGRVGAAR